MQMSNLGDVLSKLVYSDVSQTGGAYHRLGSGGGAVAGSYGGLGVKPPAAGRFLYVLGGKKLF